MAQAINTAVALAAVRSKIDLQQQMVQGLETLLQETIVGGNKTWGEAFRLVENVYGDAFNTKYENLKDAINEGIADFGDGLGVPDEGDTLDQTGIRQMLYQARALLGELRVEEQHWNAEVNEEKARRKDLGEFSKG